MVLPVDSSPQAIAKRKQLTLSLQQYSAKENGRFVQWVLFSLRLLVCQGLYRLKYQSGMSFL